MILLFTGMELVIRINKTGRLRSRNMKEHIIKHLYQEGYKVTETRARRELRKWLHESDEGKAVEEPIDKLLG